MRKTVIWSLSAMGAAGLAGVVAVTAHSQLDERHSHQGPSALPFDTMRVMDTVRQSNPGVSGAALRLDDEVLRTVIDGSPDGLLICDRHGTVLYANAALAEMTGWLADDLVGQTVEVLVPDGQRDRHADLRASYQSEPSLRPMGQGLKLAARRKDGSLLHVEISLSPVTGSNGMLTVASVRDVTERLEAERRLRIADEALTLADERERIARDLHDTVLQRLFGLGLELQAVGMRADPLTADRLEAAVDEIDRIIRDIRTSVFTLGSSRRQGSLGQELAEVATQAKRVLGFTPHLRFDGPVESLVSGEIRTELIATIREALGNVARHAHAHDAVVELSCDEQLVLRVLDDGVGLAADFQPGSGNGIPNLAARAAKLGGSCTVANRPTGGVELLWKVPLPH
jgi:PAS domain S-box-containing protein